MKGKWQVVSIASLLVGCIAVGSRARADENPASPSPSELRFIESPLQPGVFLQVSGEALRGSTPSAAVTSRRGSVPVEAIGGFDNPASVVRSGDLLYVGNTADNDAKLVTVVDISTSGEEAVIDEFDTSLNPVDLAVAHDRIYVIDQNRNPLSYRPLAGGEWTDIPLPNGTIAEWSYGDIIYPLDHRVMVIHMWENLIDVVDADTDTVELTIDDLEFLPNRIVFTDEYMIVLGVGLSAPSCSADGPNFSVFNLSDFQKVYQKDISGQCALSITHLNGLVYVVFNETISSYELETGDLVDSLDLPNLGRHVVTDGHSIIIQHSNGAVRKVDSDLTMTGESAFLLDGPQIWYPPIEEMVAADASDGRLFVTNRNDNTLSIAFFTPETSSCEGDANGDGTVDPLDSGFVLARFGCPVGTGDPNCDAADQNGDGVVDPLDVGFVLARFGPCA